jgi:hypothetical protein
MDLSAVVSELRRQLEEINHAIRSLEAFEVLQSRATGEQPIERKTTSQDLKRTTSASG